MDNIISIILKDQNKIKKDITDTNNYLLDYEKKTEILQEGIFKNFEKLEQKIKKIKSKIKKLEIIIIFLFITNLTTIYLLWR